MIHIYMERVSSVLAAMWCRHVFTFSGSVTVGNHGNSAETPELSAQVEVASVKSHRGNAVRRNGALH